MARADSGRILLVDDDWKFGRSVIRVLEPAGWSVRHESDAKEALGTFLAARNRYDIVIVDKRLGGDMDGIDLIHKLAGSGRPVPHIVLLTGYGTLDDAKTLLQLRVPFSICEKTEFADNHESLIEEIRTGLRQRTRTDRLEELLAAGERIMRQIREEVTSIQRSQPMGQTTALTVFVNATGSRLRDTTDVLKAFLDPEMKEVVAVQGMGSSHRLRFAHMRRPNDYVRQSILLYVAWHHRLGPGATKEGPVSAGEVARELTARCGVTPPMRLNATDVIRHMHELRKMIVEQVDWVASSFELIPSLRGPGQETGYLFSPELQIVPRDDAEFPAEIAKEFENGE